MSQNSCDINNKDNCSSEVQKEQIDLSKHWDNAYQKNPQERLGWYETDLTPTLNLIAKTGLDKSARVLNIGAGSTTLVDELANTSYQNVIATDISEVALNNLKARLKNSTVEFILDDVTHPTKLKNIEPVDLWIDRAVLHFFTEKADQDTYFSLLNDKIAKNGFALIAEFSLDGATKCSGLPVQRYSKEMLVEKMKDNFDLVESFDYLYTMQSGAERPYIYTLFRRR